MKKYKKGNEKLQVWLCVHDKYMDWLTCLLALCVLIAISSPVILQTSSMRDWYGFLADALMGYSGPRLG